MESMSKPILRAMGKRGRTTIPWEIRREFGFRRGDLITYRVDELGRVIITREKLCDHCADVKPTVPAQPRHMAEEISSESDLFTAVASILAELAEKIE